MSYPTANFTFQSNYEVEAAKPLDNRFVTPQYSHLTSNPWTPYVGMLCYVSEDTDASKRGLYVLAASPSTTAGNWEKVGSSLTASDLYTLLGVDQSSTDEDFLRIDGTFASPTVDLSSYSNTTTMNTAISTALSSYSSTTAMNTAISTALSSYSSTTAMNTAISTALSPYATTASLSGYATTASLATVATSGSYNDLSDTPSGTLPAITGTGGTTSSRYLRINADGSGAEWAFTGIPSSLLSISSSQEGKVLTVDDDGDALFSNPTKSNWNETDSTSAAFIQNKPTIPSILDNNGNALTSIQSGRAANRFPVCGTTVPAQNTLLSFGSANKLYGRAVGADAGEFLRASNNMVDGDLVVCDRSTSGYASGALKTISRPFIKACGRVDGGNPASFDGSSGFSTVTRSATGTYDFAFSSAASHTNYVINATLIEANSGSGRDDIIVQIESGSIATTGFSLIIHEGDNGGNAGTLRDRDFTVMVVDYSDH
jgi:hypothetical protein